MVIGKTSPSISKAELLSYIREEDIVTSILPQVVSIPCIISSPLRKDEKPSFSIYISKEGNIRYKDFANNDRGTLLDLCCKLWNCSIAKALEKISQLPLYNKNLSIRKSPIKTITHKSIRHSSDLQVVIRPWHDYDFNYWASYGIDKWWLCHYAEIYPISYKIIIKKDSNGSKKYVFPADKYAYCYVERKEKGVQIKVYQPFNKKGYKWCSKMDASVIGLWAKLPSTGDKVIICSSLKDALCVACQLHIPTLCLQGEGYSMSETAVNELKRRFNKVYVSYDGDKSGVDDAKKLCEKTKFINIPCPIIDKAKDWSDIFHYFGKSRMIYEFNKAISS